MPTGHYRCRASTACRRSGRTSGLRTRRPASGRAGKVEIVYLARVAELARPEPPLPGLTDERTVGVNGTRISARLDGRRIGLIEVAALDEPSRYPRNGGLADVGNLHVEEAHRRRGVATWLLGRAAAWLELGGVERLLDYATPDETALVAFLAKAGFSELTRTSVGGHARRAPSARVDGGHPARRQRKLEPEHAARARLAREADPAAVRLDDLARHRRPSPLPAMPLSRASPRKNFVNMRGWCSVGMPMPSSRTSTRTDAVRDRAPAPRRGRRRAST